MKTVLLTALVACAGLLAVSAATGGSIRVTKVEGAGTLELVGTGKAVDAREGLVFAPGSILTTGADSTLEISLGDAGTLQIGPSSRLHIGERGGRWVLTLSQGRSDIALGIGTYRLRVPNRAPTATGPRAEFRAKMRKGKSLVLSHGDEVVVESDEGGDSADVLSGGVFVGDEATGSFVPEGKKVADTGGSDGKSGGKSGESGQQGSSQGIPGATYVPNSTLVYPGEDLSRPDRESTRVP